MKLDFLEELEWRGMLHDMTPEIKEHLSNGMVTGYIGFDPTAASMTIGNYVQIMILAFFQKAGHRPIVLMGGATGRIGDPSGKDKERELKSYDELDSNLALQKEQLKKFLNFKDGENKALLVNNYDFYKEMNVLDFLRKVGKNLTVSYMLSKESVKKRLESGISFTEFSYQLLQAYDFLCLYRDQNCSLQMGGSDQWGNITSGTEFIRRNIEDGKAFAITTPLLTKSDGNKFGKSEEGNIWLDARLTSPYKFYQFWINADDADIPKFFRYFSFRSKDEIEEMDALLEVNPRKVKAALAEELTVRVHSQDHFEKVLAVSQILFNPKADREILIKMETEDLETISLEIPSFEVEMKDISTGIGILDLMAESTQICQSKGEARRAVLSNAVSVNKQKVESVETQIDLKDLIADHYLFLENGKKNKFILRFL